MTTNDSRLHWLDNLRWVTVLLVLVYHVIYFYNNKGVFGGIGGFDANPTGQPQDVVMYILYPWFMLLLFLVAGISARYALERQSHREFVAVRTRKLLVPATIGLFVFQWMTGYFNIQISGVAQGVTDKMASIPSVARWFACALSGTGPLWFVQDLWLFSLLLVLVRRIDREDKCWNWCGNISWWGILLLGVLVFLGSQALVMHPRPDSADGLFNLYKPLTYLVPFLLGYWVFSHPQVQDKVARMRMPLLVAAIAAGVALVVTTWGDNNTSPQYMSGILNNLYAWLMMLALMGCFKAWCDVTGRFATYMTRSSYGIYVVHYLVIASLGYMMRVYTQLPVWSMYLLLLVAVMMLSPAIYELVRRIPVVCWCVLGMKGHNKKEKI